MRQPTLTFENRDDDPDEAFRKRICIYRRGREPINYREHLARSRKPERDRITSYEETRDRYVKGFAFMVMYQCDALIEKFNVTSLIVPFVGSICLRLFSRSGVFDKDSAAKAAAIHDSELREDNKPTEEEASHNVDGKRTISTWLTLLEKSLPLSAPLAISLLACHLVGASNILPVDLAKWAREDKIPYPSCYLEIKEEISTSKFLRNRYEVISSGWLDRQACSIADIIGLPLPSVDLHDDASNYLNRLDIGLDEDNEKILLDLACLIQKWSIDKLGEGKEEEAKVG